MSSQELSQFAQPASNVRVGHTSRVLAQLQDTLSVLKSSFADETVTDIMINGPDDVFVDRQGRSTRLKVALPASNIRAAIALMAGLVAKEVGERSGQCVLSARLPGFRVEAILPPVAVKGPSMCIRRHATRVISLEEYISKGVISTLYAEILQQALSENENFLIVGATGSGKTTLFNTLLSLLPESVRLFVIEVVQELSIVAPNSVLIECDDEQGMTPRKAVQTAMRYKPDRVILGELRGEEAWDWKVAANTGHPGSAATIHANSAELGLARMEDLIQQKGMLMPHETIRAQLGETVQWLFYIQPEGNSRRLSQICRVHGFDRASHKYDLQHF